MSDGILICGVDDSEAARRAAHVAAELSRQLGSRLVLVHVARVTAPPAGAPSAYAKLHGAAIAGGKRVLERLKQDDELADAEERVELGSPAQALLDAAASQGADMLVVGTRGRGPLAAAVLGSVSTDLVTRAACPVVVVPPNGEQEAS
jgi:nucleotide-binding universal stress UspA family protein